MKRVLVVSYLFPPLHCGVGRVSKLVKYLPQYGWEPTVLTVKRSIFRPIYDYESMKDIPSGIEIIRTHSLEYDSRAFWKFFSIPDQAVGWVPFAIKAGVSYAKKHKINAILSSSLPSSSHLAAYWIKKYTGLPWVADFRDLWTQNPFVEIHGIRAKIENWMERSVVETADFITGINPQLINQLISKYPMKKDKAKSIYTGFDPDDFFNLPPPRFQDKVIFTYIGSLYGRRKADYFLEALARLDPTIRNKIEVNFIGRNNSARVKAQEYDLENIVKFMDEIPRPEALKKAAESNVLLLFIGRGRGEEDILTGKIFEYLALHRHILAMIPPKGAAKDLLEKNGNCTIVPYDDVSAIKCALERIITGQIYQKCIPTKPPTAMSMAEQFSKVLDALVN